MSLALVAEHAQHILSAAEASRDELLSSARRVPAQDAGACNVLHALGDLYLAILSAGELRDYVAKKSEEAS